MIAEPTGKRGEMYYKFARGPLEYDYEHKGLLRKTMSNVLVKVMDNKDTTKNKALKGVLSTIENSIVFISKYIDTLKNFKNITKYNR